MPGRPRPGELASARRLLVDAQINPGHRRLTLGMSRRHEQKHLLHNWSDCRYRDRPQTPRAVLRVGVASGSQRSIPTGERSGLLTLVATTESGSSCVLNIDTPHDRLG
jgi:hypothetical protein